MKEKFLELEQHRQEMKSLKREVRQAITKVAETLYRDFFTRTFDEYYAYNPETKIIIVYGECEESVEIPLDYLDKPEGELKEIGKRLEKEEEAKQMAEHEARQRAKLARLKAKYEPPNEAEENESAKEI